MQPQTFIFFGPSGSGKGTQARLVIEKLEKTDPSKKVLYLETGGKLREFAKENSFSARKTKEVIESGGLMPEFLPIWIWAQFFVDNITGDEHLVIDGISRKLHEAWILDTALQFYGRQEPTIISLNVSPEWATERLEERGRMDDKAQEIKRRMEWFKNSVKPNLEHFKKIPYYKFLEINGEQSIEEVHQEILSKIEL
ncbi:MAG: nucleoside monophosphate kinase [Patescibacteria group bacterium]